MKATNPDKNSCISYLLLHNRLPPKCSSLKQKLFIILQFLWVRNLGLAQMSCLGSGSPTRLQSRCQVKLQSSQGFTEEGSASQLTHVVVKRSQIATGCWPETLVTCHMDLSLHKASRKPAAVFPKS